MKREKAFLSRVMREFDLPKKVAERVLELGGLERPEGWTIETVGGWLMVTPEPASIFTVFDEPARAYQKVPDVKYPSGQWLFAPRRRLSDCESPQAAVQALSELLARFSGRLRGIVRTTDVDYARSR